ncbi:hypothetical protein [Oricola indica]|jgi:hypothetical protein|nr:hypothetical protein [Oricola indica]
MTIHLPRLMLAAMLCSVLGLGLAIKSGQAGANFTADAFTGTTFDHS